ncbi:MAG: hypothetical protein V3U65_10105 [Granulosicoccaceae bacterium]
MNGAGREAAGNFVPFDVWFNFLMGFVYIVASIGLWRQQSWGVWLAMFTAAATLIVFAIFGIHILQDGLYVQRTISAMTLRSGVWLVISVFAYWKITQPVRVVRLIRVV